MTAAEELQRVLDANRLDGRVHAVELNSGAEVGLGADELVVSASIFKLPVLVELVRRYGTGELDPRQRVHLPADEQRTEGGTGYSVVLDDVETSLRDLALSMMSVSDNRATDVIMARLGLEEINATQQRLGYRDTVLFGDCNYLFGVIAEDLGLDVAGEDDLADVDDRMTAKMRTMRAATPARTTHTTPRETTDLLRRIWLDDLDGVLDAEGCAEVRRILGLQVWPHRLGSGFPEAGVRLSGKTGTIAHLRSEAAVIEFPDGAAYAVAVFVSSDNANGRNPVADAAIGSLGRAAIDALR